MYFDEEQNEQTSGETLSTQNNTKGLTFQPIDTGDFEFWKFEDNPVFIGRYVEHWINDDGDRNIKAEGASSRHDKHVSGLVFKQYGTEERFVLSENYKLLEFFVVNPRAEYDYTNGIFRIEYKGKEELKGGKSVAKFDFQYSAG
jgi:hypothetical protein